MTIRQFDVVPNPSRSGREHKPFLVCIQHRHLDHLKTRVVAPLLVEGATRLGRLNPVFVIAGKRLCLDPTDLGTVQLRLLGEPVANLEADRDRIVAALDLVFTGI